MLDNLGLPIRNSGVLAWLVLKERKMPPSRSRLDSGTEKTNYAVHHSPELGVRLKLLFHSHPYCWRNASQTQHHRALDSKTDFENLIGVGGMASRVERPIDVGGIVSGERVRPSVRGQSDKE